MDPIAVVDIGSNSVRLVIFEGLLRAPHAVFNEKVGCGLGRSVAEGKPLDPERVEEAMDVLARFCVIIRFYRCAQVLAVATAAVRDAEPVSQADFLSRGSDALGAPIRILSEEEEGYFAGLGVLSGLPGASGVVGDLGGGSMEFVRILEGEIREAVSLPLGVLRLQRSDDESTKREDEAAAKRVAQALEAVPWLSSMAGTPFLAVGGNWRNFARAHMSYHGYPLNILHGYVIPTPDISFLLRRVQRGDRKARGAVATLKRRRQSYIRTAAVALEETVKAMGASQVVISGHGVREGLIHDALAPDCRARDPLIEGARAMANRMARTILDDEHVTQWLRPLVDAPDGPFAQPRDDGSKTTREERETLAKLRQAAIILSDIGWGFHNDHRASRTADLVLMAPFYGIDHPGRVFLATALWFRYTRIQDVEGKMKEIALARRPSIPPHWRSQAEVLGHALHLAFELTGGAPNILAETSLSVRDGELVLTLNGAARDLKSYDVEKRLKHLAATSGIGLTRIDPVEP